MFHEVIQKINVAHFLGPQCRPTCEYNHSNRQCPRRKTRKPNSVYNCEIITLLDRG